jgi:ArsR family transcriptional regulator
VQTRIGEVHAQRAAVSRDFFARVAEKFQAQQDLIASLPQYRDGLLSLLDALALDPRGCALEVGPGDGAFLPDLARRFARVTALDNAPAMLELARQRCQRERLDNVELRLADALGEDETSADCVVLNMVLHHFAAPAEAMKRLAQRVNRGGSLLLTELCSHDQGWARQACGDLWLGFEQDELARWAESAGLEPGESLYLGLRNGFQLQLRQFARPDENRVTHR